MHYKCELENRFAKAMKLLDKKQCRELYELGEEHAQFDTIRVYFAYLLDREDITIQDVYEYQRRYRLPHNSFLLNVETAAKITAKLFLHYIQEIKMPDPSLGLALGEFYIAGTDYIYNMSEWIQKLSINERVQIIGEPKNPYDKKAVKVLTMEGEKLGYIPRARNAFPFYMIENGENLIGQIKRLEWTEEKFHIKVLLYAER